MYMIIERGFNSYGKRISIKVDGFPVMDYYGYSQKDAERKYREKFGLRYKRLKKIEIGN